VSENIDHRTVEGFGDEWSRFDQSALSLDELEALHRAYFSVFPWGDLPAKAHGFDLGCGSGRWAQFVLPRVGHLHCIDPSEAIAIARRNLAQFHNVTFHRAAAHNIPLDDASMDFGYSLGVLHHIPDPLQAMRHAVRKLKVGAPLLVYLYYRFDNRPAWFRGLWRCTDVARRGISRLPHSLRYAASQVIAFTVYLPLSRAARLGERLGADVSNWPLTTYRHSSLYTQRTDALDRFGTALEQRFTKPEIQAMMEASGLRDVRFSESEPFWCAVGIKG
jgi:SAM-dependent methyltransferase